MMNNRPKVFISHSQNCMAPTEYAMRIIELLGCEPIIAERQPKGSNSVNDVVRNILETCDAAIVIATKDLQNGDTFSPSNGVSVEMGLLETNPKFKSKYFVVIEEGVTLSAMNNMAWYAFNKNNFGPIAEAILVELGSMNLFKNYYELPGSEMNLHKVAEKLNDLKRLGADGVLDNETFKSATTDLLNKFITKFTELP